MTVLPTALTEVRQTEWVVAKRVGKGRNSIGIGLSARQGFRTLQRYRAGGYSTASPAQLRELIRLFRSCVGEFDPIFNLVEDDNEFVWFHAAQRTIVFGGFFAVGIGIFLMGFVLEFPPFVGWVLLITTSVLTFLLLVPLGFVFWALLTCKTLTGECYAHPIVGEFAERDV
jgi:uncharacterized membrane protein